MQQEQQPIEVFISHKSADVQLAKELYHFLKEKGLRVFESDETLPQLGSSDYRKAIDKALDECKHMIVVGSSLSHISSSWVEAEWGFYIGEKRAGRKAGNILTVITPDLRIEDLPASLRYYEVIYFKREHFGRIASYVGKDYEDVKYSPPRKSILRSRWILPLVATVCIAAAAVYYFSERRKPFDSIISLAPAPELPINPAYPPFENGELFVSIGNREEKQVALPNQATVFRQIPAAFRGKKVAVRLASNQWKLANDSTELRETILVHVVPDGTLGEVVGNVRDARGHPVADCTISIDADTSILTNAEGVFTARLPYKMQKKRYVLSVSKEPYASQKQEYFPGSPIDVLMK